MILLPHQEQIHESEKHLHPYMRLVSPFAAQLRDSGGN